MDDGIIQKGKRVCAAPPAGSVGRIPTVGRPAVRLIFLQPVIVTHILREADCLEHAHILSTGKHIGSLAVCVDIHHNTGDQFLFIQLQVRKNRLQRGNKITPDQRFVGNERRFSGRDLLRVDDFHRLTQIRLAVLSGGSAVKKQVQRKEVAICGVDTIPGKAAAQAVGAVMHRFHALNDLVAGHPGSIP